MEFDETKYYLGKLCKHNHEYENTGKSLRRKTNNVCIECDHISSKDHYSKSRDKFKNRELKNTYGITLEQYQEMYEAQNGLCAICGQPETHKISGKLRALSVDHNHINGVVRGLLCYKCNTKLGVIENKSFVDLAKQYLRKFV